MPGTTTEPKSGFLARLRAGLGRTRNALADGLADIFSRKKLDTAALQDLEDVLIAADLGVATASKLSDHLAHQKFDRDVDPTRVQKVLADIICDALDPVAKPLVLSGAHHPEVILFVGVNGTGKTTTIGKLAARLKADGKTVLLGAADTFRAAAIEQLQIWGQRNAVPVVSGKVGSDPAAVAFDALQQAKAQNIDVVMIDTAGRLQNKTELMDELRKVVRVVGKFDVTAPHHTVLVLDATTGQNALNQVDVFSEAAHVTGLIMTKLDGTARGGVLVACAERFGLPIHAIGVGEGIDDLQSFEPRAFADALVGL